MAAASSISAIKVDTPRVASSPAPTRAKIPSRTEITASSHATKLPSCAIKTAQPTDRINVLLPPIFGPEIRPSEAGSIFGLTYGIGTDVAAAAKAHKMSNSAVMSLIACMVSRSSSTPVLMTNSPLAALSKSTENSIICNNLDVPTNCCCRGCTNMASIVEICVPWMCATLAIAAGFPQAPQKPQLPQPPPALRDSKSYLNPFVPTLTYSLPYNFQYSAPHYVFPLPDSIKSSEVKKPGPEKVENPVEYTEKPKEEKKEEFVNFVKYAHPVYPQFYRFPNSPVYSPVFPFPAAPYRFFDF
ncbi:unnamed protein product [Notodromas monacha]|uniref:Uncharacterized protein n=1 Tax=Notodromas monacha TaxID=399045 RepID=A0A7R9BK99_9CRUS|nr:unnamed protein product [Notodromas monacha]CAG0916208.1 unnamed protein product [Notodromas monacha]